MSGYFNEITNNIRLPFSYVEFDATKADRGLSSMTYNGLVVGQMSSSGTGTPLTIYNVTSEAQGQNLFGPGSMAAAMCTAWLKANTVTKLYALGVSDLEEGTAAQGSVSFSGTVTSAAPIYLYVGGQAVVIGTSLGVSGVDVTNSAVTAINSASYLPVTAAKTDISETSAKVVLTAKHKGLAGNDIDLRLSYYEETLPEGISYDIVKFTGGTGNPAPGPIIASLGDLRYHIIAWPWTDAASLNALKTELDDRWGPLRQNDGQAITVKSGSYAEVVTFTSGRNDKHLTVFASEGSPTLPWVDAAASSAVIAYYGEDDPARPFQTLSIPGVLAPNINDRWADFPEKNQALYSGCSARGVSASGDVIFLNVITTYRFNPLGAETSAYLQLNSLLTLSYIRYDWKNWITLKYPRHKLCSNDEAKNVDSGQAIITPLIGRAEAISRMYEWVRKGLVEAPEDFISKLIVERDPDNPNRLNWVMAPDLVNQFRVAATSIQYLL